MSTQSMAVEVFCSYAHEDQALLKELEKHLATLKRQNIIASWYDGAITPGEEWKPQIMEHLNSAQIILLLVSADFINSDFCYGIELEQALTRQESDQARVIPIILRPVDWKGAPFAKLQVLPTGGKPVTNWPTHDDAFLDVVQGIRKAIDDLTNKRKTAASGATTVGQAQAPIWNVPYQRNLLFTGREEVLKRLYEALRAGKTAALAQPQAISGLGGIGKTQTAVEYAYRNRDDYQATLWVKAETDWSIISDFVTIAQLLDLLEQQEQEQLRIVETVKRWFLEHSEWLLIFDNADDLVMVRNFLPPRDKGHILLTTRARATGRMAQRIEVEKMEPEEGALFLLHRATILDPEAPLDDATKSDRDTAKEIVQVMDGLPLALEQAGAYIEETECGLQGYLRLYRAQGVRLLKEYGEFAPDHPKPVATTWSLSFEKVEQANAAAAELLRFCAFLAPDAIPEELFAESAAELGPTLEPVASDPSNFNVALRDLLKYSLVDRDPETNTLSIHRLVQEVLKDQMEEETQRLWAERVLRAVNAAFPHAEFSTWPQCERVLPQALTAVQIIEQYQVIIEEAGRLLAETASYLQDRGRYAEAEPLFQSSLATYEQQSGPDHPDIAFPLNSLALLYQQQGKSTEAEPLYKRALAICEQQLGPDHPDVAYTLKELAGLYRDQGKYTEAELLYQRSLAIYEQQLGPKHPDVATPLNNLAILYSEQGEYAQAEPLFQRALEIREQQLGPEHPTLAYSLLCLANLYSQQSRSTEAESLYQRSLAIWEQHLGPDHPFVAYSLNGLADLYRDQGKDTQAELLYQRALQIREQRLGTQHPDTAQSLGNLALLYQAQGKYKQAEPLYERALAIYEQQLGLEHPGTQIIRRNYVALLRMMGREAEAVALETKYLPPS